MLFPELGQGNQLVGAGVDTGQGEVAAPRGHLEPLQILDGPDGRAALPAQEVARAELAESDIERVARLLTQVKYRGAVASVTCREKAFYPAEGEEKFRVALMDYGAKRNIVRSLQRRGCSVTVWPAESRAEEVFAARYCVGCDIYYTDGSLEWHFVRDFSNGTHGWERVDGVFLPPKPVKRPRRFAAAKVVGNSSS